MLASYITDNNYIMYIIARVSIIFVLVLITNNVLNRFELREYTSKTYYTVIRSIVMPVKCFIWLIYLSHVISLCSSFFNYEISNFILFIRKITFIFFIAFLLFNLVNEYELNNKKETNSNHANIAVGTICRILKLLIAIFVLLTTIQTSGINISGLLTFGSVSGIVLGFASKDLLANFFGAALIYLDKPFEIGDWVRSPDKNIEGTVESISWRLTRIRTLDKRPLYIPNSIFNSIVIENASRMSHRRIKEVIGVRYCDVKAIKKIVNEIKKMLIEHKEIASDQTLIVNLIQFNSSSVDIMVYSFTRTTDWIKYQEVKQEILLKISEIIDRHGAEIAFPSRTLYIKKDN